MLVEHSQDRMPLTEHRPGFAARNSASVSSAAELSAACHSWQPTIRISLSAKFGPGYSTCVSYRCTALLLCSNAELSCWRVGEPGGRVRPAARTGTSCSSARPGRPCASAWPETPQCALHPFSASMARPVHGRNLSRQLSRAQWLLRPYIPAVWSPLKGLGSSAAVHRSL